MILEARRRDALACVAGWLFRSLPLTLAAALLIGAIIVNFSNVVGRYLLQRSIYWADEAMVFLVIWSVFLAAVAVAYEGGQLAMDLFSARLPGRGRRVLDVVIAAVSLATFAFMAWQAGVVIATLLRNDQRSIALDIPMAIPQAALLVGFAAMALAVAVRAALGWSAVAPVAGDDVTSAM